MRRSKGDECEREIVEVLPSDGSMWFHQDE